MGEHSTPSLIPPLHTHTHTVHRIRAHTLRPHASPHTFRTPFTHRRSRVQMSTMMLDAVSARPPCPAQHAYFYQVVFIQAPCTSTNSISDCRVALRPSLLTLACMITTLSTPNLNAYMYLHTHRHTAIASVHHATTQNTVSRHHHRQRQRQAALAAHRRAAAAASAAAAVRTAVSGRQVHGAAGQSDHQERQHAGQPADVRALSARLERLAASPPSAGVQPAQEQQSVHHAPETERPHDSGHAERVRGDCGVP